MDHNTTGAAIAGTAKQCIQAGQIDDALELYWALEGTGFVFDSDTRFLQAKAWSALGQYDKAREIYEELLGDESTKGKTFRANVVREYARVLIKLDQSGRLEELLNEAEQIYKKQHLTAEVGTIHYLQGLVLIHTGNLEDGMKKIAEGTTSEMRSPDFVPTWLGKPAIDPRADLAKTALAVAAV